MAYLTVLLWLLAALAAAQAPQDPIKNFCRRYGHQTAVIDRRLYIDGGWVYANPISQNPTAVINQGLIFSDLNQVNGVMPAQHANLTKNNTVPDVAGGILWQDDVNKAFWLYGGEFASAPSAFQLWGYDTILNQWNISAATTTSSSPIQRVAWGAGTSISELGRGYYYGGYLNNLTNPLWSGSPFATNSMIVFDMDENTMTNYTGPDNIGRAEGVMVSIPASTSGLLIYFGGVQYPYGNTTEKAMDMSNILVYDIDDAKWYTQQATGDIPGNRRKFCAGATWPEDQSSYNIYLYGGYGFGENSTGFDDVYILSLPTFEWIKWYPDGNSTSPGNPHGMLSCNVISHAQMIVMGGNATQNTDCDAPDVGGQHNLNLGQNDPTQAMWYSYQPGLQNYTVPSAITAVAGGSSSGAATNNAPQGGFDNPGLAVYFGEKAKYKERTPYRSITSARSSKNNGFPIGAVVGGVVGGVAVILIIAVVLFYCRRGRRNKTHESQGQQPYNTATNMSTYPPSSPTTTFRSNGPPEMLGSTGFHHTQEENKSHYNTTTRPLHSPNSTHSSHPTSPDANPPALRNAYTQSSYHHPVHNMTLDSPSAALYPQPQTVQPSNQISPPISTQRTEYFDHQHQYLNRISPPVALAEMPTIRSPPVYEQTASVHYPVPQRFGGANTLGHDYLQQHHQHSQSQTSGATSEMSDDYIGGAK